MNDMKLRVDRATLADAATWVAGAIGKRPTSPALGGVRLSAVLDRLTLSAFDYDMALTATIAADVVTPADALLPGRMLRELAAAMKPSEVELVADGRLATLSGGRANYRIPTLSLEDWPNLPKPPKAAGQVDAGALARAVRTVRHAIDDDSAAESVRGVYMTVEDGRLRVVGLSSPAMSTCLIDWSGGDFTARVPVAYVETALKGLTGTIDLGEKDGTLSLADADRTVTIRCYSGDFARWTQLLREESAHTARLDVEEFADAVHRVALTQGRDVAGVAVRVTMRPGEVEVEAGEEGIEVLDADVSGLDVEQERTFGLGSNIVGHALAGLSGPVAIGVPERDTQGIEFRMADDSSVHYLAPRRLLER